MIEKPFYILIRYFYFFKRFESEKVTFFLRKNFSQIIFLSNDKSANQKHIAPLKKC
jgi:hypothetical protein